MPTPVILKDLHDDDDCKPLPQPVLGENSSYHTTEESPKNQ